MRGRTTPRLRTALVGAAASVALVAGVGFVATTPDSVSSDQVQLVQAQGASLVQGEKVDIDLKKLVEAQIGGQVPEGTTLKLSGLPKGLTQDGWRITGTPEESGLFNVRVEVTADGQTSKQDVQLMVAAPSGEKPNAPTTDTEQGGENGGEGTEPESESESATPTTTPSAEAGAEKTDENKSESSTESSESEKTDESTTATTTSESGAENESDDKTESGTETTSETTTETSEASDPEFPTEDEAFGEGETTESEEEGTEIDLDEATGSLTDGMLPGTNSTEGSLGGDEGAESCDTGDLTAGLEKFLPVVVGEQDDSGMITSIITSVLGTLLPTVLNTASSGNGSVCEAGGATGSLLESAAGFADSQQNESGAQTAGAQAAGAQAAGGNTTLDSLLGGDGTQLMQILELAGGIMNQAGGAQGGAR